MPKFIGKNAGKDVFETVTCETCEHFVDNNGVGIGKLGGACLFFEKNNKRMRVIAFNVDDTLDIDKPYEFHVSKKFGCNQHKEKAQCNTS